MRHRGEGLGERADLVDLDEDRVADAVRDAFLQDARVGDEDIVADQLHLLAETLGEQLPAAPVVLRHAVLDGDDRVTVDPGLEVIDHLLRRQAGAFRFEAVDAVFVVLGRRAIDRDRDVAASAVTRLIDRLQQQLQRGFVRRQVGREPALVAHCRRPCPCCRSASSACGRFRRRSAALRESSARRAARA